MSKGSKNIKRITIIGPPGSGKSTLAQRLAVIYDLPVVYMDKIAHSKKYNPLKDEAAFLKKIEHEIKKDKWIMEGGYPRTTLEMRMKYSDLIILLDFHRRVYIPRVFKRRVQYHNKKRIEMPDDWKEKLDKDFLKYVWNYHNTKRGDVIGIIKKFDHDNTTVVLRTPKELTKFLQKIERDT